MKKKRISMILCVALLFSLVSLASMEKVFASEGAWVLKETLYGVGGEWQESPRGEHRYNVGSGNGVLIQESNRHEIEEHSSGITHNYPDRHMHVIYTWTTPPEVLQADQKVSIEVEQEVRANVTGGLWINFFAQARRALSGGHFEIEGHPGKTSLRLGQYQSAKNDELWVQGSTSVTFSGTVWSALPEGTERILQVQTGPGRMGLSSVRYVYEWQESAAPAPTPAPAPAPEPAPEPQPAPTPAPPATTGQATEATDAGNRMEWPTVSGVLGYRIFRSTDPNQLGESVTDFFIEELPFIDVNIQPNTDYHYTVKPVLREASPLQDIQEELGEAIATYTVRSSSNIISSTQQRSFIVLTIDKPHMIVNGVAEEIDPGRGTVPRITSGRTMVPIRAIVEAMGGTVGWDGNESKITLNARGNQVEMWLNRNDIRTNGSMSRMDVAPVSIGGRTFVPLRFSTDNLDARAEWINSTREVVIIF